MPVIDRIEVDGETVPNRYVSPAVAAAFLSLAPATLAAWRSLGVGPAYTKLSAGRSGAVRYPLLELERFARDPQGYAPRPVGPFRKPSKADRARVVVRHPRGRRKR